MVLAVMDAMDADPPFLATVASAGPLSILFVRSRSLLTSTPNYHTAGNGNGVCARLQKKSASNNTRSFWGLLPMLVFFGGRRLPDVCQTAQSNLSHNFAVNVFRMVLSACHLRGF